MPIEEYYKGKTIVYEPPDKTEYFKNEWIETIPQTIEISRHDNPAHFQVSIDGLMWYDCECPKDIEEIRDELLKGIYFSRWIDH